MKKTQFLLSLLLLTGFFACDDDADPTAQLLLERQETTAVLTSNDSKTWKISQATLTNSNGTIDISTNFNVIDDEFIFSGTGATGSLEWRKGYEIQTNAATNAESLLDKYVAPIETTFNYQDGNAATVEADFGSCTFAVNDDNSITATITGDDNSVLSMTLGEKTANDFLLPPPNGLTFTNAFTFESNSIACCAPGMIGSYRENSLYIVMREQDLMIGANGAPERIIKFDFETNTSAEKLFFQSDFVSKQLHIIGDELIVVGGRYVNKYNLDLSTDPISRTHGKRVTRFGISVLDEDVYIIGGDLDDLEGEKIFKWNLDSETLSDFTSLPVPRTGARATIVNNDMYVFGGGTAFAKNNNPSDSIFKIDVTNPSQIDVFKMNKVIDFTFVQKYQNLIYVAGKIEEKDAAGDLIGRTFTIGVFNTQDNTYQELATNLTNPNNTNSIHQMCVFNDKMYIIFGANGEDKGGDFREWEVLVSDLN